MNPDYSNLLYENIVGKKEFPIENRHGSPRADASVEPYCSRWKR